MEGARSLCEKQLLGPDLPWKFALEGSDGGQTVRPNSLAWKRRWRFDLP